jgi:alkaline phosphatase D
MHRMQFDLSDRTPGSPTGYGGFVGVLAACRLVEASSRYK